MQKFILAAFLCLFMATNLQAENLRALAKVDMAASGITDTRQGVAVALALTQAVPYRVYMLDAPMRVVIEFQDVAFQPDLKALDRADRILAVGTTRAKTGGSALVLELADPMEVTIAELETADDGRAMVRLQLAAIPREAFAARANTEQQVPGDPAQIADTRLVVALDPGHGGTDPGSQHPGASEAQLMLQFALELKEALLRGGVDEVVMTRQADQFVALPTRISAARAAGADLFLSLHADARTKGRSDGIIIHTLSQDASDQASAVLAERQDRLDIVAGVDLRAFDDEIATVLMDLARLDIGPRAVRLADQLVTSLDDRMGRTPQNARQSGGYAVLKAPDIPSVLIEMGGLSATQDRARIQDATWRSEVAGAIVDAVALWALDEAARAE